MRLFFAAQIPDNLKRRINLFANENSIKGSLVEKKNYHITLKFIGEVNESEIKEICNNCEKISFQSFLCSLKGIDAFPNRKNPEVLWIGINRGYDNLIRLNNLIDSATKKFGNDFNFKPHLTIARNPNINKNIFDFDFVSEDFSVSSFFLMQSVFENSKVSYKKIKEFKLKN